MVDMSKPGPSEVDSGLLTVSEEEWKAAIAYFSTPANINKVKLSKKDPTFHPDYPVKPIPPVKGIENYELEHQKYEKALIEFQNIISSYHSFDKFDDTIYAIANSEYLGIGGFGKVKVAQNHKGENFAIKTEGVLKVMKKEKMKLNIE